MPQYSGPLDGGTFSTDQPFVVFLHSTGDSYLSFATKCEAWDYIATQTRYRARPRLIRLYGFEDGQWMRLPAEPTYLQRREVYHTESRSPAHHAD